MSAPAAAPLSAAREHRLGLLAGAAAFVTWGLVPIYWKLLQRATPSEILAHRFIWTAVFLILLISWQRRWPEVLGAVRSRRARTFCLTSGSAIAINWFLFIWAVNSGRVIETSLGYFMTPLVNVLFGALFLREHLTRWQFGAILLAAGGVLYLALGYGRFPYIALSLCFSFGLYGLLRKQSGTAAIPGLFLETIGLVPFAIAYLVLRQARGTLAFGPSQLSFSLLLMSAGIVTGLPLVWFGYAARHLRLTTIGFMQYLAPSCTFILGVFVYHETFTRGHLIAFSCIWIALAIFTAELLQRWRAGRRELANPASLPNPVR